MSYLCLMEETTADRYKLAPPHQYLFLGGIYYIWTIGTGWKVLAEKPDVINWSPLHPNQLKVHRTTLIDQGLISSAE